MASTLFWTSFATAKSVVAKASSGLKSTTSSEPLESGIPMISLVSRGHVIGFIEKDTCPIAVSEDFLSKGSVQTSGFGLVLSCASRYSYQRFKVGSDSLTPDLAGLVYVFLDF